MPVKSNPLLAALSGAILAVCAVPAAAQPAGPQDPGPTFADIADLADSAGLVVLVEVAKMLRVENERAPGLQPGYGRFYIEAKTRALLTGSAPLGESVKYLVDLPLDARGKPPKLKKHSVFLFARAVPGHPGELQLVSPTAQWERTAAGEARLRRVLQSLVSPDAPAKVTGVRELFYVPGNLAGQGETQIFLKTEDGSAASITVRHDGSGPPVWGVSFSELVADMGRPPQPGTLTWYRLACFLPNMPPPGANVSDGFAAKRQAEADYRMVLGELGVCRRNLS
ncbi:hypothetical protein [Novosphingobium beihaiensis]|uniref:Uncharacterized protein n=1 Tax=Novosphingobium beihaiensis TaxID=2930389 RepID=A0ABT0BQ99_9SPHN|nr:hypothetical protein [Novosphingobium beihaiensis]MCJ2187240.1 hypothetical protein [Novosphingobium beihaiensis]